MSSVRTFPPTCRAGMTAVGAAAGDFSLAGALRAGAAAGSEAASAAGFEAPAQSSPRVDDEAVGGAPLWFVQGSRGKAFVDPQHDVTTQDIAVAAREGFYSAELLKRYTTLGMGTDQGKTSALNGHALDCRTHGAGTALTSEPSPRGRLTRRLRSARSRACTAAPTSGHAG